MLTSFESLWLLNNMCNDFSVRGNAEQFGEVYQASIAYYACNVPLEK